MKTSSVEFHYNPIKNSAVRTRWQGRHRRTWYSQKASKKCLAANRPEISFEDRWCN